MNVECEECGRAQDIPPPVSAAAHLRFCLNGGRRLCLICCPCLGCRHPGFKNVAYKALIKQEFPKSTRAKCKELLDKFLLDKFLLDVEANTPTFQLLLDKHGRDPQRLRQDNTTFTDMLDKHGRDPQGKHIFDEDGRAR